MVSKAIIAGAISFYISIFKALGMWIINIDNSIITFCKPIHPKGSMCGGIQHQLILLLLHTQMCA